MSTMSLTTRISLLFAIAASLVLLTTGFFLSHVVEAHFKEGDRHELNGKLELIQNLFKKANNPAALKRLPKQLDDALVGHHGLAVAVADATGNLWYTASGADFLRKQLHDCQRLPAQCTFGVLQEWEQSGAHYRGMAVTLTAGNGDAFTVAAARDIHVHESFMTTFRIVLAIAIVLAALATAVLGWVSTRWGLRPLRRVTETISGISAEHLSDRLPTRGLPTELEPLAIAFNAMLARLDDSFRRLSEFSSNIAHELRTPISNLMTQTQVALSSARDKDAYKEILYSSLEEYERMAQMVSGMLYLAQADNGLLRPGTEIVDLEKETQGLFDYFEAWAEERLVSLTKSGSASVSGDKLMLRRALSNLISNAIRHTPPGQAVHVAFNDLGRQATVSVENPGPDIPAEHFAKLFDRFYRIDPSRQRSGDGAGLGLAIVKSIVDIHGGTISVTSTNEMTRFQLIFPALGE
ncbi:MAG: heavy metal sensor histidine kinase [Sulfuriferula multivorans]|uniref:Sensor protein n=1 Tax=Sulfuriferula multivorans TaxID=1559896 RepID=A0A7C9NT83_9PROT|nr:heavy metal sensor histidine kinase [Sulfuriferula multivorans]